MDGVKAESILRGVLTVAERTYEMLAIVRSPQGARFLTVRSWPILLPHVDSHAPPIRCSV
jgi:hypothetical protein